MKKLILTTLCLTFGFIALAQKNIPVKGSWVVESNVKDPKNHVVHFYNDELELIYQEKIAGKRLNIDRAKAKKALNEVLATVLKKDAYQKDNLLITALARKAKKIRG